MKTTTDMRIGALLRSTYQEVSKIITERLSGSGYEDIRPSHFTVLQPLFFSPPGLTVTELADRANITKQSMGDLVKYLEKRGYVERQQSETDLRVWILRLTPKGEKMQAVIYEIVTQIDEDLAAKFGTEKFRQLRQLLLEFLPLVRDLN